VSSEDIPQRLAGDWRWLWDRLLGSPRVRCVLESPSPRDEESPEPRMTRAGRRLSRQCPKANGARRPSRAAGGAR
jgi:hypothetical protein